MPERKFLIPNPGHLVRKENNIRQFVKEEGELLPYSIYYRRRVMRNEMVIREDLKDSE